MDILAIAGDMMRRMAGFIHITEFGTESHDVYVRDGMAFVAQGGKGSIGFYNVSDPVNIVSSVQLNIPNSGYVHNTWLSQNGRVLVTTEETNNKTVKIWNIENLSNIELLSEYLGPSSLAHNAHVDGEYLYISHYTSGLSIVDLNKPDLAAAVGLFNNFPGHTQSGNTWGVYPYSSSSNIYISDMNFGLYVLEFNGAHAAYFTSKVLDSNSGLAIGGCLINIVGNKNHSVSDEDGHYAIGYGLRYNVQIIYNAYGYHSLIRNVDVVAGVTNTSDVYIQEQDKTVFKCVVKNENGDPIPGVKVSFERESSFFAEDLNYYSQTNSQGICEIEGLLISDPVQTKYKNLLVEGPFPYARFSEDLISLLNVPVNELEITLKEADLLIINKDPNGNYGNYYSPALTEIGETDYIYNIVDYGNLPDIKELSVFTAPYIIWTTGTAADSVLTPTEIAFIGEYLQSGRNVILTGQNIAEYLDSIDDPFLSERLHCTYVENTTLLLLESAMDHPINEDHHGLAIFGTPGADNQFSQDVIVDDGSANVEDIFYYFNNPDKIAALAIQYPEYGSKLFFASFGLEAIGKNANNYSLTEILQNIEEWFSTPLSVTPEKPVNVVNFLLKQNCPNPFNPSTMISYQLSKNSVVKLVVYDMTGRVIKILVDEPQNAGVHNVEFNDMQLASGIYFYRLESEGIVLQKKMLLIK